MRLNRPKPLRSLISLVSMIDVLMIMLVFFMVTSTYLHLDMLPMAERGDASAVAAGASGASPAAATILIRLTPDGMAHFRGAALGTTALAALIHERLAANPRAEVILLPSGHATVQAMVSLMDTIRHAGVARLRIVRLEAQP